MHVILIVFGIVLTAYLAATTVNYVSSSGTLDKGKQSTSASAYMNIAETIRAAAHIYKVNHSGKPPENIQDLVDAKLLGSVPEGQWSFSGDNVVKESTSAEECAKVNKMLHGEEVVYNCSDMPNGKPGCCDTDL